MGQYGRIPCPICHAQIEVNTIEELPEKCPACKERIVDAVRKAGDGTGINTAVASGPNLKPLSGLVQNVY